VRDFKDKPKYAMIASFPIPDTPPPQSPTQSLRKSQLKANQYPARTTICDHYIIRYLSVGKSSVHAFIELTYPIQPAA
jgi:hypothetical protein